MKSFFLILAVIGLVASAFIPEVTRSRRLDAEEASSTEEPSLTTSEVDASGTDASTLEANTEESSTEGSGDRKCKTPAICYDNDECDGCLEVLDIFACSRDEDCGRFDKTCNTTTGFCDCVKAVTSNRFEHLFKGTAKLCNTQACNEATLEEDCYGLPCQTGRCIC